ncbi:MAG: hypothetical protein R8G66_09155 [Cytophagales bacterium]|nr:hypothetical protein [Cytophagales bacterium]
MTKKQISFWPLFIEFASVVFAVLLALGLNSYKQNQDLKEESRILSKKILAECRRNLLELDTVNTQNEAYLIYLDSLLAQGNEVSGFSIDYNGELLTSSAWKYTQNSKAFNYIDSTLLNDATIVYELQDYYMKVSGEMFQNIGEMVLNSDNIKSSTLIKTSHYFTRNAHEAGKQLAEAYKEILEDHRDK